MKTTQWVVFIQINFCVGIFHGDHLNYLHENSPYLHLHALPMPPPHPAINICFWLFLMKTTFVPRQKNDPLKLLS